MNLDAFRSIGEIIDTLAAQRPDDTAMVFVSRSGERQTLTYAELKVATDKAATLISRAVAKTPFLAIVELANCPEHFVWAIGVWKAGGCCAPISPRLAEKDRRFTFEQLDPDVAVSSKDGGDFASVAWIGIHDYKEEIDGDLFKGGVAAAVPSKVIMTAGTTGTPKAVYQTTPMGTTKAAMEAWFKMSGQTYNQMQLLLGPLGHGSAGSSAFMGVMAGHTVVIQEKFDAAQAVELIKEYRVQAAVMVPTMMKRISDVPGLSKTDLSSFESLSHTGAYCSRELKHRWIDLIGAEHVFEIYSMSENIGTTLIRGDEWLEHEGSVGRAYNCEIQIRDHEGTSLPVGEVGEIFMKPTGPIAMESCDIKKALEDPSCDGFFSVGDMGFLNDEGYLYFSDRRSDMIVTGGMNVFACEVERAILASPWVSEAAVIGVTDSEWGQKIRAYLVLNSDAALTQEEIADSLKAYLKTCLNPYKVPKEYHVVDSLPKSEVGKVLRSVLRKNAT